MPTPAEPAVQAMPAPVVAMAVDEPVQINNDDDDDDDDDDMDVVDLKTDVCARNLEFVRQHWRQFRLGITEGVPRSKR